jgi:hypothetical protein
MIQAKTTAHTIAANLPASRHLRHCQRLSMIAEIRQRMAPEA